MEGTAGHPAPGRSIGAQPDPDGGRTRQLADAAAVEAQVLATELAHTSAFAASYERTASWRVTAPLRRILPIVRVATGRGRPPAPSAAARHPSAPGGGAPPRLSASWRGASPMWQALDQRLRAATEVLLPERAAHDEHETAASVLSDLIRAAPGHPGAHHWLVLTAVNARFPTAEQVRDLARLAELENPSDVAGALLASYAADTRGEAHLPHPPMQVVTDAVVVDVDYCARHDTHTGIQRVVREVVPMWAAAHSVVAVAHTTGGRAFRGLEDREKQRVFAHGTPTGANAHRAAAEPDRSAEGSNGAPTLLVPWRTCVVLPDVMDEGAVGALAALAEFSGSTVALVGYDMIPILSAELRPVPEADLFAAYLVLVKHAHRVAAISRSAADEFRGFAAMLPSQGLAGPTVVEVMLAEEVADSDMPAAPAAASASGRPMVLAVGRREPHKNLGTVLQAAELLWDEHLHFELVTVGGLGWIDAGVTATERRLVQQGRPLTSLGWVSAERMVEELHRATVTVFVSLHEGYGLQVAESLVCGTPVITSDYGSQREIAEAGGCLVVDPRDDQAVAEAIRRVLTEPGLLDRLRDEVARRPRRTWAEYAVAAWDFLVEGKVAAGA